MNNLKVFENQEFGKIRIILISSEPWFVGKDIAIALGYAKPQNAIATHVSSEDKTTALIQGTGSNYKSKTVLINESGFYSLVLSSKLPTAKRFKRWVTSEVLPTLRKTGSYQIPKVTPNPHYRTRMVGTAIRDIGKTAKSLEDVFGVRPEMALVSATSLVGEAYGIDMTPIKPLIPTVSEPEKIGTLTPKAIAAQLGVLCRTGNPDSRAVNKMLEKSGLQEKHGKEWRLTEKGRKYGEARPYTRHGHSGYQINWREIVLELLKGEMG